MPAGRQQRHGHAPVLQESLPAADVRSSAAIPPPNRRADVAPGASAASFRSVSFCAEFIARSMNGDRGEGMVWRAIYRRKEEDKAEGLYRP